ncbi:MAG: hypothetical protein HQL06_17485 [Nitrospirae bacterium]|nr:hypothetical protein [Nitrospirota bacterium]
MPEVIERVDRLEEALVQYMRVVGEAQAQTEAELREFKEEMRLFREETRNDIRNLTMKMERTDEQLKRTDEQLKRTDAQLVLTAEQLKRTDEQLKRTDAQLVLTAEQVALTSKEVDRLSKNIDAFRNDCNVQWGKLSAKQGTMVEDLIHPSLPRIIQEYFGFKVIDMMIRRKKECPDGNIKEFDAIAVTKDYVFLNSTKSSLSSGTVKTFIKKDLRGFKDIFPEYAALKLVGILASLFVEKSVLIHAQNNGLMVLGVGGWLMEVKNIPGFIPKQW